MLQHLQALPHGVDVRQHNADSAPGRQALGHWALGDVELQGKGGEGAGGGVGGALRN